MAALIYHFVLALSTSMVITILKFYPTVTFASVIHYTGGPIYRLPIDTLYPPTILVNDGLA